MFFLRFQKRILVLQLLYSNVQMAYCFVINEQYPSKIPYSFSNTTKTTLFSA